MMWSPRFLILLLMGILPLNGCDTAQSSHSATFSAIFGNSSPETGNRAVFRGARFGMPLDSIRLAESLTPLHNDDFGLTYETTGEAGSLINLEYLTTPGSKNGLESIIISVQLDNELSAIRLYREVEDFLNGKYGVPRGPQGNYYWDQQEAGIRASLRLQEDKRGVVLNYLPYYPVRDSKTDSI